jgi:tetratricopeptide (TPR) repeat protein
MVDESKGRQLHKKALKLREQKHIVEAQKVDQEALDAYAKDNDTLGFSELLSMHAKSYLHQYHFSQFKPYLLLAKHIAEAGVEIAENTGDPSQTILPIFNLGEVCADAGDLKGAIEAYRKAVDRIQSNVSPLHNRTSVLANMKVHLYTTEYTNGDKSALERAEEALSDLEKSNDASDYEKHVWISGAHMRIAKMLITDNQPKAREHLLKAKEIIDSDPELVIRKEQWEKLAKELN